MSDKFRLPAHLIGWAIFFIAPLLLSPGPGLSGFLEPNVLWPTIVRNLILVGLFYANLLYLTPVVLKRYGIVPFLLVVISAVVIVSLMNGWIHMTYTEYFGRPPGPPSEAFGGQGPPPGDFGGGPGPHFDPDRGPGTGPGRERRPPMFMLAGPMLSSFLITIMVVSFSTTMVFWSDWNNARRAEQERALQKVASELAILKLQVSPHFLFNTLNNIRWLIRSRSEKAEEAVVKLSQLLRYILYQTNDEKVSLGKEVDNLQDLVELQKMRLVNESLVSFNVSGDSTNKKIVPLLFVPLVENFFKHGDFDGGHRAFISLEVTDDRLLFRTENAILPKKETEESGIGVANVRRRLELHYPHKHFFSAEREGNIYKLNLEVLFN